MTTKRMTSNDYAKELHKLELDKMALEKRIIARAKELMKANPDVMIQLLCFINQYKASELEFPNATFSINSDIDNALIIIETIETDIASKHPHKQTTIQFPKTQHEKLMDIAKGVQAIGINIEKNKDINLPKTKK